MKRTDEFGRAFAGSQLQVQLYVNRYPQQLADAVASAIADPMIVPDRIAWVSPLESADFCEYKDAAFLKAVELSELQSRLAQFWPLGGPRWDALGIVQGVAESPLHGVVLIEAKSYLREVYGSGCQAKIDTPSRLQIEAALAATQRWLGVSSTYDWTGPLYQYANRLAHLYFFREQVQRPAWLVNLCFVNDPRSPTDKEAWQHGLAQIKRELGLEQRPIPYTVDVFLPARPREELEAVWPLE